MKIFIDPGHNYSGGDTGAQGNGLKEQNVTFEIALELKTLLINAGHEVKMSRNKITDNVGTTVSTSINTRASLSNQWGADLFVSIHCNAGGGQGTETLVYSLNSSSVTYAKRIQDAIVNNIKTKNRGVKARPDLGVLKLTNAPALLVETAFIDSSSDSLLLKTKLKDFAESIFEGIVGKKTETPTTNKVVTSVAQTVMQLPDNVYIQEIKPSDFEIIQCDSSKKNIQTSNYFNCGYFAEEKGGKTIPVGNLANNGEIYSQAKDNASWINVAKKKLTTIYTTNNGKCDIAKTDNLSSIQGLKTAVSGIPIIVGGKQVSLAEIKSEGYFGNELYDTWHGFLGIRHGKLVYVAMKCAFNEMCWAMVALGIYDAIKLDGGGSFILKNGKILQATSENRRIHNIGTWN